FSSTVKPLDISRTAGLQDLLDHAQEDPDTPEPSLADLDIGLGANSTPGARTPATGSDPYRIRTFAEWQSDTATSPVSPRPANPVPQPHREPPMSLIPGQTVVLPEEAWQGMLIAFTFAGADADLTLFLTGTDSRVSDDQDFVFYNQPSAANGAARLLGKQAEGPHVTEKAAIHLTALPEHVQRVVVFINMDVDTGLNCAALTHAALYMNCATGAAWTGTERAGIDCPSGYVCIYPETNFGGRSDAAPTSWSSPTPTPSCGSPPPPSPSYTTNGSSSPAAASPKRAWPPSTPPPTRPPPHHHQRLIPCTTRRSHGGTPSITHALDSTRAATDLVSAQASPSCAIARNRGLSPPPIRMITPSPRPYRFDMLNLHAQSGG
ncbi:TerD family protein, partial [Streptomyces sp. NPDC002346]